MVWLSTVRMLRLLVIQKLSVELWELVSPQQSPVQSPYHVEQSPRYKHVLLVDLRPRTRPHRCYVRKTCP